MNLRGLLCAKIELDIRSWEHSAGLVMVKVGPWYLHLLVKREHWVWGFVEDWYDGPLPNYGLGPFFLLAGMDVDCYCYHCDDFRCKDRERHGW